MAMIADDALLRKMKKEDIDDVLEIERTSFTTPWSREAFTKEIDENNLAHYIVVEKKNKVVAYGGIWLIVDEGHITNIAVHPDYRGQGIGNILVEGLIDTCKEMNVDRMTLEVRRTNHVAQSLYDKYGFESCGIRPRYYTDTNEDAIIMWKEV